MKKVLIFVSNGFEALELSPFLDIFGWNNILCKSKIKPVTVSISDSVVATWNLKIMPEINLTKETINIDEFEALIIPGGFGKAGFFKDIQSEIFKKLLYEFHSQKKLIVGICTGALALAINGILKKIPATTYLMENKRYFSQLKKYGAIPIEKEIVRYKNIITSSAPNTAILISFYLVEVLLSKENRVKVEENTGFKNYFNIFDEISFIL